MAWSKESRHKRGYGTAWDKLRLVVLQRDCHVCTCSECQRTGRIRPATEVDHRIPKGRGGTDDLDNLGAINSECHKRKTLLENGGSLKPRIGADGWPIHG
jgi:5-methylcytosine-specific restriction protein A